MRRITLTYRLSIILAYILNGSYIIVSRTWNDSIQSPHFSGAIWACADSVYQALFFAYAKEPGDEATPWLSLGLFIFFLSTVYAREYLITTVCQERWWLMVVTSWPHPCQAVFSPSKDYIWSTDQFIHLIDSLLHAHNKWLDWLHSKHAIHVVRYSW